MKLNEIAEAAGNSKLNGLFEIAIKRAAFTILADLNSPAPLIAWAKRAHFEFGVPRTSWYASRVLEGALNESSTFRDAVALAMTAGDTSSMDDATFVALVSTWVQRFAAAGI
jgi:hypothetical protein